MPKPRHQNGWVEPTGKKPKTWTGYFYVYEGDRRLQRSKVLGPKTAMTKEQAREKLREYIKSVERGVTRNQPQTASGPLLVPSKVTTFGDACDLYLRLKKGDWHAVHTRSVMASLFKTHIKPFLGDLAITEIKPTVVKEWINGRAETQSKTIVQKCLTHVRAVFQQLIEDDLLVKDPTRKLRPPKTAKRASERYLEVEECRALIGTADGRDRIILRLFFGCALRPSEVFALRLDDVFPGKLRIDEGAVPEEGIKDTKTEQADGFVPLPRDIEIELREYIQAENISHPRELLFPSEVGTMMDHKNFLRRRLKPIAEQAGIKDMNHQIFRRTVATHFQRHGAVKSAQGLLRHASASTTLKHYQKTIDADVVAAAESWDAELTNKEIEVSDLRELYERRQESAPNDGVLMGPKAKKATA